MDPRFKNSVWLGSGRGLCGWSGPGGGPGGEMTQALYAHMNNKTIKNKNKKLSMFNVFTTAEEICIRKKKEQKGMWIKS
jgi:hypothetical protein